ncbi:MAG TPA: EcsC family protein [Rubricoccaceae bacterium]|nr:EcsC family protein [Rubricoccaceae bacterium]
MKTFILHQLYPKAVDGLPLLGTPERTAAPWRHRRGPRRARAEKMIRPHLALAGTTGFVTGLGGWLTMPVTVPADLAGVALLQLHMAASCAALAGRDVRATSTREEVVECLLKTDVGENTEEEEAVERVGVKLAERGLRYFVGKAVSWGAKQAGERLLARRFARGVPLVGGAIGAASDVYITRVVAGHALDTFFPLPGGSGGEAPSGDGLPDAVVHLSRPF